jgi:hypothetical protein
MADYNDLVVSKEEFETDNLFPSSEKVYLYTDKYPLLEPYVLTRNLSYQIVRDDNINMITVSGYDFLSATHIVSYLNFEIAPDSIYLNFTSSNNRFYDTIQVLGVSGNFGVEDIIPFSGGTQRLSLGNKNRIQLTENEYFMSISLGGIPYSGACEYLITPSANVDVGLTVNDYGDYFVNENLSTGEIIFTPRNDTTIRVYNLMDVVYPYSFENSYYVDNDNITSGNASQVVIDEYGNTVNITHNGLLINNLDIPVSISNPEKYFELYKQTLYDKATREKLIKNTDYIIDYFNGTIALLDTSEWDEDTIVWIEKYIYDETYYKYISSVRDEIGDISSDNYKFTHSQIKRFFHKALQKILFWVPLSYSVSNNYITPKLTDRILDFVSEYAKILALESILNDRAKGALKVVDGDTSLDLTGGMNITRQSLDTQKQDLKQKVMAELQDYLCNNNYQGGFAGTAETNGSLWGDV